MNELVEQARSFARKSHGDQKYGDVPYSHHIEEVVCVLVGHGLLSGEQVAAGYLHDVLEDCDVGRDALRDMFGDVVEGAVSFCTDEPGGSRSERKSRTYERCRQMVDEMLEDELPSTHVTIGLRCKLADRIANLRAGIRTGQDGLLSMYELESQTFLLAYRFDVLPSCRTMLSEYRSLIKLASRE